MTVDVCMYCIVLYWPKCVCVCVSPLSLSWNPMTDLDTDRICRGASRATALCTLELDCCDISTNGAMLLAMMLKGHPNMVGVCVAVCV